MLDYLRLMRFPNVFTAMADVAMGYAFIGGTLEKTLGTRLILILASSCLYIAGMVLNDVYDLEIDRVERPERPLPSGRIAPERARKLGYGLLLGGLILAFAAGLFLPAGAALPWRSGVIATLLAICIVGYDAGLKRTPAGPIVMGSCRFFNVLLGMSLAASVASGIPALLWYEPSQLLVAAGIGVYIIGVTWFARSEATTSQRLPLILGLVVMAAGIACLAIFPQYAKDYGLSRIKPAFLWQIMLLALFVPIFRRGMNAVINPSPQRVQAAVKNCILSLIMFDAAISVVVGHHQWGIAILLLLVPALLLGRWVYST